MSTVVGKSHFTPEDVLRLSGDERFELVDGQLVSTDMSALASAIAARILHGLSEVVAREDCGVVMTSEASYRCFRDDPDRIRRPDGSFIHRTRMRPQYLQGHIPIAPDLALEVVSPNDLFYEVRQKIGEYVDAGVRLIWVVNPDKREIEVYRVDGSYRLLHNGDSLDGEDIVPGFVHSLAEIFRPLPMDVSK
jgi:Uma2 family endonuclease